MGFANASRTALSPVCVCVTSLAVSTAMMLRSGISTVCTPWPYPNVSFIIIFSSYSLFGQQENFGVNISSPMRSISRPRANTD